MINNSIKRKLTWIIVFATSIVSFISYAIFINWYIHSKQKQNIVLAKELSQTFSQNIAKVILLDDLNSASDLTSALSSFTPIKKVVIHNQDKIAIYEYKRKNKLDESKSFIYKTQVFYNKQSLGSMTFTLTKESLIDILKKDIIVLIISYFLLLILSYLISTYFAKYFTEPLLKLVSFLKDIQLDKLTKRISTKETNEYALLYTYINEMLDRIQQAQDEQKLAAIAFETQAGMIITDANEKILRVNEAFSNITGYTQEDVLGKTPSILKSNIHTDEFYNQIKKSLQVNHYWSGEIYNKYKNGKTFPNHLTIQAVLDDKKDIQYYVTSFIDISTQKEAEAQIIFLQEYDALTGLANRQLFIKTFQTYLNSKKHTNYGSVICFNIRDFKIINDTYGYKIGDLLLQEIAQKLKKQLDSSKNIAKIGLDEFIICSYNIAKTKKEAEVATQELAESLILIMKEPFYLDDKKIHINIYVGIEIYTYKEQNANEILTKADSALSLAKTNNKEITFFDTNIEKEMTKRLNLHSELIYAIQNNELELYYQLQYNAKQEVYGAEALIRWHHPQKGLIPPDMFIPLAEKTGLIIDIGDFVIDAGCKQLELWQKNDITKDWVLALNVSAKQFHQDNFMKKLEKTLEKYTLKKENLKIELTESLLVKNLEIVQEKMNYLRSIGIKLSLDDFGTGYSSLQYLKILPLNQVKIDQNFVMNMLENKKDIAIIQAIINLSTVFDFEVIAEGVETKEVYDALIKLHCYHFQGYYFAKPQPIDIINKKFNIT